MYNMGNNNHCNEREHPTLDVFNFSNDYEDLSVAFFVVFLQMNKVYNSLFSSYLDLTRNKSQLLKYYLL